MNKPIEKNDLWCHYSDLPSPLSYMECTDYDGIGNQGRFPRKIKNKEKTLKGIFFKLNERIKWKKFI